MVKYEPEREGEPRCVSKSPAQGIVLIATQRSWSYCWSQSTWRKAMLQETHKKFFDCNVVRYTTSSLCKSNDLRSFFMCFTAKNGHLLYLHCRIWTKSQKPVTCQSPLYSTVRLCTVVYTPSNHSWALNYCKCEGIKLPQSPGKRLPKIYE